MNDQLKQKLVLIVDDEPLVRELFNEEFTFYGSKVYEAGNIADALKLLKAHPIDLVISDLRMPGGDGLQLLKNMNAELNYKPHFFLCSGYIEANEKEEIIQGLSGVFLKPFDMDQLIGDVCKKISTKN